MSSIVFLVVFERGSYTYGDYYHNIHKAFTREQDAHDYITAKTTVVLPDNIDELWAAHKMEVLKTHQNILAEEKATLASLKVQREKQKEKDPRWGISAIHRTEESISSTETLLKDLQSETPSNDSRWNEERERKWWTNSHYGKPSRDCFKIVDLELD